MNRDQLESIHACHALGAHHTAEAMAAFMAAQDDPVEWDYRQAEHDKALWKDRQRVAANPELFGGLEE